MEIANGARIQVLESKKYKDIAISFRFLSTLSKQTATIRSLLALMMIDRSMKYNTKKEVSDIQDNLYGITLRSQTLAYGKAHAIEISGRMIDPIYVKEDKTLMFQMLSFYYEMLFHPLLTEETLEEAKKILRLKLLRQKDDPSQAVILQGLKIVGKNSPLEISSLGELEYIEEISLDIIKEYHNKMLQQDQVDILLCGNVDTEKIKKQIQEIFPFPKKANKLDSYYKFYPSNHLNSIEYEYRDVKQSNIFMIWSTNCSLADKNYYALRVACAMFGQYPTSLLFQEVREKRSLCYSISSNLISYDGVMGVSTGVSHQNIEATIAIIQEQFKKLCKGDFSMDLLNTTKRMINNSLLASKDSIISNLAIMYQNHLLENEMSIEDRIQCINRLQKEDIIAALNDCKFVLSYVITNQKEIEIDGKNI